jgi:hypothetical protein
VVEIVLCLSRHFEYLVQVLDGHLSRNPPASLARAIPGRFMSVRKQLGIAPFKLGYGGANFDIREQTVADVVWRVTQALVVRSGVGPPHYVARNRSITSCGYC